ncbi:lysozyme [Thioclava sp. DLFJ4-1]|uniref:lysozyme n=1 Tax=Thioclava sp. DLFJ4-1 TaxID=1915313 RepID=UPI0009977DAA|nr:lysozyme [Thioclava sp. DLFJ4-1]OOY16708.1 hypothetical protein BMI85_06485 [Thioclava sp. DLFJ4-1]
MKLISKEERHRARIGYSFAGIVLTLCALLTPVVSWSWLGYQLDPNAVFFIALGLLVFSAVGRFIAQPQGFWANLWRIGLMVVIMVFAMAHFAAAEVYRPAGPQLSPSQSAIAPGASVTEHQIIMRALPEIKRHEGVRLTAYRDPIGIPTICSGTIRGVSMGMTISAADCDRLIASEATEYWRGVSRAMTLETKRLRINVPRGAAWTDFTINVGIGAASKSTAMRRLNDGNVTGSCKAMTWFNKAGGFVWVGLVVRRDDNYDMCMVGA